MIKNEFQKIYRKIISQAPIFDTFDDQIIKPKLVKRNDDYYRFEMKEIEKIDIDKIISDKFYGNESVLYYYYLNPMQIYDAKASQDFKEFKIKSYNLNEYNDRDEYYYEKPGSMIALQFSMIYLNNINKINNMNNIQIIQSFTTSVHDIINCDPDLNGSHIFGEVMHRYNGEDDEGNFPAKQQNLMLGGMVFIYNIVDLVKEKTLYFDYDIFENKKFFTGITTPTGIMLHAKMKKYFKQAKVFTKIANVLTQKLIEIKNNY